MKPKISIIVPVYNTEQYLRKCLDSIVNQTLKEIEIICINDGSPDNSSSILSEYANKDNRIVVINQSNKGVSAARNAGLAIAKGQFVGFVDSDDWIEPDTYATAIQYMADDVDLVCWGVNVEGDAKEKEKMAKLFDNSFSGKVTADLSSKFSLSTTICDKLFRKAIIKDNDIKFPEDLRYEDTWFLWKYMLHVSNFYYIEHKFYNYIQHQGSFMASKSRGVLTDRIHGLYNVYLHYDKFDAASGFGEFFARRFYRYFRKIYQNTPSENKRNWLEQAADLAKKMNVNGGEYSRQLEFLKAGEFYKLKIVIEDQPFLIKRVWLHIKSWV